MQKHIEIPQDRPDPNDHEYYQQHTNALMRQLLEKQLLPTTPAKKRQEIEARLMRNYPTLMQEEAKRQKQAQPKERSS